MQSAERDEMLRIRHAAWDRVRAAALAAEDTHLVARCFREMTHLRNQLEVPILRSAMAKIAHAHFLPHGGVVNTITVPPQRWAVMIAGQGWKVLTDAQYQTLVAKPKRRKVRRS